MLGKRVIRHEDIDSAVEIVVAKGDAQAFPGVLGDARRNGNIGECAVAVVAIEQMGNGPELVRMAVSPHVKALVPAPRVPGEAPIKVTRDEKVEVAVVVVVEKRSGG